VDAGEFDDYFAGTDRAVAITVRTPRRLEVAVPLRVLRHLLLGFQPPQSFRYMSADEAETLLRHADHSSADRLAL
jgi:predicted transcriptional regulator